MFATTSSSCAAAASAVISASVLSFNPALRSHCWDLLVLGLLLSVSTTSLREARLVMGIDSAPGMRFDPGHPPYSLQSGMFRESRALVIVLCRREHSDLDNRYAPVTLLSAGAAACCQLGCHSTVRRLWMDLQPTVSYRLRPYLYLAPLVCQLGM